MSMLAGPRRKQKVINLRAKNNAWSNDNNKFGQRMLEKMGWSSGKGLGANENGIVEHVVARYKNDEKGLGFEDKNDQWTKHEDDFNALLANLSNTENNEDKLHSGISLEAKSKTSKARIHYHKFTRGKDLSRYSEKDLANIFGKKSFKNEEKPEETLKEDINTTEQVFTEKGSMEDYFKNKLAAFKTKNKLSSSNNDKIDRDDEGAECGFRGFINNDEDEPENNHQGFGFQSFSFCGTEITNGTENENITEDNSIKNNKKGKNKEKSKKQIRETSPEDQISLDFIENKDKQNSKDSCTKVYDTEKIKKLKKKKRVDQEPLENLEECQPKKKSKSKKKYKEIMESEEIITEVVADEEVGEVHIPKKKKKRKNKEL